LRAAGVALLKRHRVLTIRNLTAQMVRLGSIMRVIKIQRTIVKSQATKTPPNRRSVRQFARDFFANENHWEFAIEALLFGILLGISSWPIVSAVGAIQQFLASVPI
jgi:hypothetical protein